MSTLTSCNSKTGLRSRVLHGYRAGTLGSCSIIKGTKNGKGLQQALEDDLLTSIYDFPDHINKVWTTHSITIAWLCQGSQTVTVPKSSWDLIHDHTDCTKEGNWGYTSINRLMMRVKTKRILKNYKSKI